MTCRQAPVSAVGLVEYGDDGWVYEVDGTVYQLTTGELGWLVCGIVGMGRRSERCFGDRLLAERVFFHTVAGAILTHRPYTCEARIGGACLVLTRVDAFWHLAESSATPLAVAFNDEQSGRDAWQDRASELARAVARTRPLPDA